ncbi:MAG: septation protein IspZ [Alphaproteobacteria bacterium]|nr:septation protein IspZ [Alphaproteobacteria bacterium]MCB9694469.1 septation protein IspZ [Alphaproteobacteria bacterium]
MRLLLGLLPLVAFYAAESLWGMRAGVLAAVLTSLVDVAYGRFVDGRVNRVVIVSTVLVVALGGLSILAGDERYVLWTPVLGDGVFVALLLASLAASEGSALEIALREQDPEAPVDLAMRAFLRGVTARLSANLALHALLTAWSTTQPRETWLFVSGPVQYGLFALQLPLEVVLVRRLAPATDPDAGPPGAG